MCWDYRAILLFFPHVSPSHEDIMKISCLDLGVLLISQIPPAPSPILSPSVLTEYLLCVRYFATLQGGE